MSLYIWCPDTTGKTGAVYATLGHKEGEGIFRLGRFICDKINEQDAADLIMGLIEAAERRSKT